MLLDAGIGGSFEIEYASERAGGIGLFIRSLMGLDRTAATEAVGDYLAALTSTGVMDPGRLFQTPYTDRAATGPVGLFSDDDAMGIVSVLRLVRAHAVPGEAAGAA